MKRLLRWSAALLLLVGCSAQPTELLHRSSMELLDVLAYHLRHAERILSPAPGGSSSVLALEVQTFEGDPAVITAQSGSLLLIQREVATVLNTAPLSVTQFVAKNTSATPQKPSVWISFTVSDPSAGIAETVQEAVTPYPIDVPLGNACGCPPPVCSRGRFSWNVCDNGVCRQARQSVQCSR